MRGERGQAMVEFALLAPLFLALVVGVIQFAVALNFWFDMNRLANQGARSAAVNCGPAAGNQCGTNLASYLSAQVISAGNSPTIEVCYVPPSDPIPSGWVASAGDAVRVKLTQTYRFSAIVYNPSVALTSKATMRLEQDPTSSSLPDRSNSANYVLAAHTGGAACQP
jgi:Flp pilus assembly protein TadG